MKIPRPKLNVIELAMWAALVAALAYIARRCDRTEERLEAFLSSDNVEAELHSRRCTARRIIPSTSKSGS